MMEKFENPTSVIYSFKAKWLVPLTTGEVKLFFRRRAPRIKPERIYLYVGSPISSIIGWSKVETLEKIDKQSALHMAKDGAIEISELERYLIGYSSVEVIRITKPYLFSAPLSVFNARSVFNFHPPQNFCTINSEQAKQLDAIGK